jgi:hypothetical protein
MHTLIIPDIHNKQEFLKDVLLQFKDLPKIFLGDYFDSYDDTPGLNEQTAIWLKESLKDPLNIHLMGNHDFGYRYTKNPSTRCSGWSPLKCDIINEVMTREDWNKLKYFHYDSRSSFYFSHAGLSEHIFNVYPFDGITPLKIQLQLNEAKEQLLHNRGLHPVFDVGHARGGRRKTGGLLWLDYEYEFNPIANVNQIFGHTHGEHFRFDQYTNSKNYCLDVGLTHVFLLQNHSGTIEPIELDWNKFKQEPKVEGF